MKCPTTSGPFRCMHDVGHAGDCEVQSPEYATTKPRVTLPAPPPSKPEPKS